MGMICYKYWTRTAASRFIPRKSCRVVCTPSAHLVVAFPELQTQTVEAYRTGESQKPQVFLQASQVDNVVETTKFRYSPESRFPIERDPGARNQKTHFCEKSIVKNLNV